MGTTGSKEGGGTQSTRRTHLLKPGVNAFAHLPPGCSVRDYKQRLATSEGSHTLYFPQAGLKVKYAFVSLRGLYPGAPDKPNQDSLCVHTHYGGDPEQAFFGIYDGHGEFGTECSQFAKDKVPENLLNSPHLLPQPERAFRQAMLLTNKQMHRLAKEEIDDSMSGTTAIALLLQQRMAYFANVGDSRAVLAEKQGKQLVAQDVSFDQTPFRRDECDRVKKCGARVLTLDQLEGSKDPNIEHWGNEEDNDGDPPRLWAPNASYPGTAFTRSIGDKVAEAIGVTAEPEVLAMELTPNHPFVVLASDGVWEFLTSQDVVDVVARFEDPQEACISVVTESYRLWLENETRTDDISMIVVQFAPYASEPALLDPLVNAGMSTSVSMPVHPAAAMFGAGAPLQPATALQLSSLSTTARGAKTAPAATVPPVAQTTGRPSMSAVVPPGMAAPMAQYGVAGQQQVMSSQAMMLNESVALKQTLQREVEQQQHLRATMTLKQLQAQSRPSTQTNERHGAGLRELTSNLFGPQFNSFTAGTQASMHSHASSFASGSGTPARRQSLEGPLSSSFLFCNLSGQERATVTQAFQQVHVKAGQLVIRQGGPGDHFYVIQSGIFDVYQQQDPTQPPILVQSYGLDTPDSPVHPASGPSYSNKLAYFGELALLYRRPRAATVVARTDGVLWSLHRNDFKAVLQQDHARSGRDVSALVHILKGVQVLGCLSGSQLRALAEAMEEAVYEDGQLIIQQGQEGQHFFVVLSGEVVCSARRNWQDVSEQPMEVLRVRGGQYFGERALLPSSSTRAASAHACGRVVAYTISRQLFAQTLGATLQAFIDAQAAWQAQLAIQQEAMAAENARLLALRDSLHLEDLEAQGLIFSTDCSALMLMEHKHTDEIYTVRVTSVADVVNVGKQGLLMRSRAITRSLKPSFFVPGVFKSFKDNRAVSEVLSCLGLCTLDMLLAHGPLDELSAVFVAASVLLGLEHLHHSHVIYRGLSSHSLLVTDVGNIQLVDFRFARMDNDGRAYTLCGEPAYLAPEMVESRGHTAAVDLWAFGVLIYVLLTGTTPFSDPQDDELTIYRRVCSRALHLPEYLNPHARSLIDGLLQLQPNRRLGTGPGGLAQLKLHPWFAVVDWDMLMELRCDPPPGMLQRIDEFEGVAFARFEPPPYHGDCSWLDEF